MSSGQGVAPGRETNGSLMPDEPAVKPTRYSLFRYSPLLFLVLIIIADGAQSSDPDLWGHLRFGQAVLASGHFPATDTYSYTAAGARWTDHEWLCEVIMAFVYNHLGIVGLKLWKLLCVGATIAFMAAGMAETGAPPATQFNIMVIAAVALMLQMPFRPQVFTFALFAALLALLARDLYRRRAPLWIVIPMMALWANLHGGFIIGAATLAAYTGMTVISDPSGLAAGFVRGLRLGGLTLAALAATLVNPYGFGMWRAVIHALRNPATRVAISDWLPLSYVVMRQWRENHAGAIFFLCGIGLIAATAIVFALTPRAGDLPLAAIAAIMCVAAIVAVRNLPLAIIACVAPLARHAAALGGKRDVAPLARSEVNPWIIGALALLTVLLTGVLSDRIQADAAYPAGAVRFMRQNSLRGNILNDFGWGEYLIWYLAPDSKVFIDGRYDTVYPYSLIDEYIAFSFNRAGAQKVIGGWPHDFVLISPTAIQYSLMMKNSGWKLIYRDGGSALFARTGSPAARVKPQIDAASKPVIGYFP